ncbi:DNA repair and recombination protein RadB [Candidatus Woesearchaeota archaeon]|nr:DNA repair and recombination protein RadB [Candidatus Woesearchaeota archaeon]
MEINHNLFNELIGNVESEVISTIYGPAGSGKTLSCMIACRDIISKGGKVLYIDTESGFSVERLKQLTGENFERYLNSILFLKPTTFDEQKLVLDKIHEKITPDIKLIVIDSISMLYRLELGKNSEVYESNRELSKQILKLSKTARMHKIPVLITNQVYSNMENGIKMVGGDNLTYMSKCLIEVKKHPNSIRSAILKKHRSQEEGKTVRFKITQSGIDYNLD